MSSIYSKSDLKTPIHNKDTEVFEDLIYILNNRLNELESKFSYQENTIDILNETILRQQIEIDTLKQYIQQIVMRLQNSERISSTTTEEMIELPPHY